MTGSPADELRALLEDYDHPVLEARARMRADDFLREHGEAVLALIDAAQERVDADPDAWLGSWLAAAVARLNNPQETDG